jgi:hypothetical protein
MPRSARLLQTQLPTIRLLGLLQTRIEQAEAVVVRTHWLLSMILCVIGISNDWTTRLWNTIEPTLKTLLVTLCQWESIRGDYSGEGTTARWMEYRSDHGSTEVTTLCLPTRRHIKQYLGLGNCATDICFLKSYFLLKIGDVIRELWDSPETDWKLGVEEKSTVFLRFNLGNEFASQMELGTDGPNGFELCQGNRVLLQNDQGLFKETDAQVRFMEQEMVYTGEIPDDL